MITRLLIEKLNKAKRVTEITLSQSTITLEFAESLTGFLAFCATVTQLGRVYIVVGLEHPYLPLFVFWCSVLCLRTVLGLLRGYGGSEPIGSHGLQNGSGTRISDQSDRWRVAAGREWCATVPDSEMSTLRRVLGSPTGPATGTPYTEIGYIAGGSGHSR